MKTRLAISITTVVLLLVLTTSASALEPAINLSRAVHPVDGPGGQGDHGGPSVRANTCPADNVGVLNSGDTIVGSTIGSTDDFVAPCGSNAGGQDEIFEFAVALPGEWCFDTCTVPACWDTVLSIHEETGGGCPGSIVACDNDGCPVCYYDSLVQTFLVPTSTYYLIVDGWSTFAYGDFTVTVDLCVPGCTSDAHCDDGVFCNGSETCNAPTGQCSGGSPPCTTFEGFSAPCDEGLGACNGGKDPVCGGGCSGNGCDNAATELKPVYLFSGEEHVSVVDLQIPGRGLDFAWSRKYRSRIGPDTEMGNGWDFSYNIRLEQSGQDLILHNGDTRRDTYLLQPDGTWTRREFFRVIEPNANPDTDTYTLTLSDTSKWEFQPFDDSPEEGKITAMVDRNGNTISFDYDDFGRLITINDTLNRDIAIAYNPDGFIESVTDFAGRSVRYTYYGESQSVTSPTLALSPHDILKNRYISIAPGNPNVDFFDIRLTLTDTLVSSVPGDQIGSQWWASEPDEDCISLVGPNRPNTPPDWSGCPTLHLTGCPIIPTSTYDIVAVSGQSASDPPLAAATQAKPGVKWWGDAVGIFDGAQWTPPQGATNIDDAVAAIKTFKDPNGFNAAHVSVVDLHPNDPSLPPPENQLNRLVNMNDVFQFILAFQGNEYPGGDIDLCPSTPSVCRETGGSFGDLKSVTTPVVVNTPEFPIPDGHDYPDGRTTVYTYSTCFADDRLNHNLQTITDPKGQTYVHIEYAPTTDPSDVNFDRVKRQTWGEPGDVLDIVYVRLVPSAEYNFANIKAILNDRVGNVKEFFYDAFNRNVVTREYTGRADPDLPTTDSANRPTGRLRPGLPPVGDPDYFERRYEYNIDSRRTKTVDANGNVIISIFDETNTSRRSQGNMTQTCRQPNALLGGDQVEICEYFDYDVRFGSCCGSNFITRHVDGRDNETIHTYDDNGNRLHTQHRIPSIVEDFTYNGFGQITSHVLPDNGSGHRRRDEYTYYAGGPQFGYLKDEIVDSPNFALTTTHEYNLVGQTTRVIDPRGHDTQSIVNQLDQDVRRISREVADGGVRYELDTFYDPNDNVARVDIQNIDDQGILQTNTHFTTIFEYEILNHRTKMCAEVGVYTGAIPGSQQVPLCEGLFESEFISTEYEYDANRNQTLMRYGEAVESRQPANVVEIQYDERDLKFKEIRAPGDPDQSTTQYDYDDNRNLVRVTQGKEDVIAPRITTTTYDGYDRRVAVTDPMGNVTELRYDPNNNIGGFKDAQEMIPHPFGVRVSGEREEDVEGSAGNVTLSAMTYFYDPMDRVILGEKDFFDTAPDDPIEIPGVSTPGKSTTTTQWSDNSQVTRVVNDNNHHTLTTYDTANRRSVVTDHLNNSISFTYDENSNVIIVTEVERSDLGNRGELFSTTNAHDNLDRLLETVDNVGNTHTYLYDSRSNRTFMDDALNHETRYVYDGIDRLIKTVRDLNGNGANANAEPCGVTCEPCSSDPDIVTTQVWDDTSRLIAQIDDSCNATRYDYDPLSRMTAEVYADTTVHDYVYDVHDNKTVMTDANESVADCTYDLLNRLIDKDITPGPGVSADTLSEHYKYDGLSRLIHAADDDSLVTRSYDSLSRVTSEELNGQTTTCCYDGVGNELLSTYPGGRVSFCTYDELERK